jgi:O-antigen ligase
MLRRFLIFISFIALLLAGVSVAVVSYRERGIAQRGWRDPATGVTLPFHTPQVGINVDLTTLPAEQLPAELERLQHAGFVWVRQPILWSDIETQQGQLDFTNYDPVIAAISKTPLKLIAVLDESPAWARKPGGEGSRYAPPASPTTFGEFAGKVAAHYRGQIAYYQLWDEPNLAAHWGNLDVRPAEYTALLRAAYTAIKGVDGSITVIAAGLAPTVETGPRNLNEVDFLHGMYVAGAKDVMDAVSGKPYGFNSSPLDRTVNDQTLNFSRLILLREEMERQGDASKPIFASHFGWNSLPADWKGAPSVWGQVDAATQQSYTRQAFERASREWSWLAALNLAYWNPNAPADDPIQGFTVRDRLDKEPLAAPESEVFGIGLHHPNQPGRIQYKGEWRLGALGADVGQNSDKSDSSFSLKFEGDSIALPVRRDDYVAYLYATVDGQPANALPQEADGEAFVLLTSPDRKPHTDTILLARNLPPGVHELHVRAYLGYERWAIAGIAVGSAVPREREPLIAGGILLAVLAFVGVVWIGRGFAWSKLAQPTGGVFAWLRRMRDVIFGVVVTFAAGFSMAVTLGGALPNLFRRDEPAVLLTIATAGVAYFSPAFILNAAALIVLFILIYNKPALGLCLVAFFAPFFLYPVQNYVRALPMVELVLLLTVAAASVRAMIDTIRERRRLVIRLQLLDWVFIAFALLATLTLVWSEQLAPAVREWRIMVIEPIVFYFLIRVFPLNRADILRLVDTLILAAVVVCVLGIAGYFFGIGSVITAEGGARRLGSIYGSPNNVALFVGRCAPFALAMLLYRLSNLRRVVAGIALVIMVVAVLLTQSAGALLFGLPAAFAVVLVAWDWKRGLLLTGVGIVVLVLAILFVPRVQSAFNSGRESSLARVNVWTSAVNLIRERPVTGAGLDQFLYLYRSRYILPDAYKEPDLSHPHNILLDFWVSLGVGGLILLLLLQIGFWRAVISARRRLRDDILSLALCAGLMGAMADFLAHGLIDNSYFVVDLAYVFCLCCGLALRLRNAGSTS